MFRCQKLRRFDDAWIPADARREFLARQAAEVMQRVGRMLAQSFQVYTPALLAEAEAGAGDGDAEALAARTIAICGKALCELYQAMEDKRALFAKAQREAARAVEVAKLERRMRFGLEAAKRQAKDAANVAALHAQREAVARRKKALGALGTTI